MNSSKVIIFTIIFIILILFLFSCTDNFINEIKNKVEQEKNETHRVIYDGNGNDAGEVPVDTNEYREGDTVTILGNTGGLTKSDYVLVGWNTRADGSGTEYGEGETFEMGDSDVTLYAHWVIETVKLVAYDGQGDDNFGWSVANTSDYIAVGAYHEGTTQQGALYIFHRTDFNSWDNGVKLVAIDRNTGAALGVSTSIDGEYVVGGAYNDNEKGSGAGAAYVFHRTGTNEWDYGTKLFAENPETDAYFGYSVGISGDYIIVGAYKEDSGGTDRGAVYIFHRTGLNEWNSRTRLTPSDGADGDRFGYSVAINGDYAVVGAPGKTSLTGAIYVFHRTGTNTWDDVIEITDPEDSPGDHFGNSVAIDGNYIVAGAYEDKEYGSYAGAAYIFHRTGTNSWDPGKKIIAQDLETYDYFGVSVGISGDYTVAGIWKDDDVNTDAGAVDIFKRSGTNTWNFLSKMTASDGQVESYLGWASSICGNYIVGGARWQDIGQEEDAGAVYVRFIPY